VKQNYTTKTTISIPYRDKRKGGKKQKERKKL
jgi:hypothetical protein